MAILKIIKKEEQELIVTYPMYFKNYDSTEIVKMDTEREGVEITKTSIKLTVLSAGDFYGMYKLATKEEFDTLFQETKSNINSLLIMASDVDSLPKPLEESEAVTENTNKELPDDFDSWQEVHFDISTAIGEALMCDSGNTAIKVREEVGTGGIYDFAKELTNKFEMSNKGIVWGDEKD